MFDYDARIFRSVANSDGGDVNGETTFHYHQQDNIVWATYAGDSVVFGTLVAKVDGSGNLDMRHLTTHWQVGDGREARLADYVLEHARRGDARDVIRVIDEYSYNKSFLINVGNAKGSILDAAVARSRASRILELGTYCGYSALRMSVAAPSARIISIEFSAANAGIARRIHEFAGVAERVTVVVGTLGDGGRTIGSLRSEHGLTPGCLDLVFIDHDKKVYVSDLQLILAQGWLHRGSLVVADNVKFPGAPEYRAYMAANEGALWHTVEHETHVEYQSLIKDLLLVSEYLGAT